MKKFTYLIILVLFCFNLKAQKNYILPEPQSISFPESKQFGFRLSKKTSIQVKGVNNIDPFINSFISFVKDETGFELKSKINKKSNIYLEVENGIIDLGDEGYKISILPKENLMVQANTKKGLFYALESLKQIIHFTKRKRDEENFNDFDTEVLIKTYKENSITINND